MNSTYVLAAVLVLFFGYRFWKGKQMKAKIPEMLSRGAVIIDVRSVGEFQSAANPSSINIPLDQLSETALKKFPKTTPIVLCCASGARSGMAVLVVKNFGFGEVINAGPWTNTLV